MNNTISKKLLYIPLTEIATQGLPFPRHSATLHSSLRAVLCPQFLEC
jgi:hypothetical protein